MKSLMFNQCRLLQICESCLGNAESYKHVIQESCLEDFCISSCGECSNIKGVCDECDGDGQISHIPSLRACRRCIENGLQCICRVMMVFTTDCEEGNKQAMQIKSIEDGSTPADLSLLVPLPNCPHVGKSLKASFANWFLQLQNKRGNLSFLFTLGNRSPVEVKAKMRTFLPKNDHVRNKDRQDPMAVLNLTKEALTTFLKELGFVGCRLIPELDKFTEDNKIGAFPQPISVAIGPFGRLLFLSWDSHKRCSKLLMARLHNPVQKFVTLKDNSHARCINHYDGVVYLYGPNTPISFVELNQGTVTLKTKSLTTRKLLYDKLDEFKLPTTGLVKILKERLSNYLDTLKAEYARRNLQLDEVNAWELQKPLMIDALYVLDNKMIYASIESKGSIVTIILEHDGVGICSKEELLLTFLADWVTVNSICVNGSNIFVAHTNIIDVISLVSLEIQSRIVEIPSEEVLSVNTIAVYKDGIIFTDAEKHRIMSWSNASSLEVFAGDSDRPGNQDCPSVSCQFYQPTGVCVEFNHVVYICDSQSGCIKIFSTLVYTAQLLSAIGKLYAAFSVHEKHQLSTPVRRHRNH